MESIVTAAGIVGVVPMTSCDEELRQIARELRPDRLDGLERLWEICGDDLYRVALWRAGSRSDAEEAVQEVFVRLARAPGRLRRTRRPRAYLMAMARNAACDLVRRRRRDEPIEMLAEAAVAEERIEARASGAGVARALAALPAAQREAVALRYLGGFSYREIAVVCGVPVFTAASRCRLGIARIRRTLGVEP